MFPFTICSHPDCNSYALTGKDYCLHHSPDRDGDTKNVIALIENNTAIRDISARGIEIRNKSFSEKEFISTNWAFAVFENCIFKDCEIHSSYFDFAVFRNCQFISCDIRYSVFAGALFMNSKINDSTAIHTNFNGVDVLFSELNANDFYYSCFTMSKVVASSLEDCNLKRTDFRSSLIKDVSFRYSNVDEAYFDKGDR